MILIFIVDCHKGKSIIFDEQNCQRSDFGRLFSPSEVQFHRIYYESSISDNPDES